MDIILKKKDSWFHIINDVQYRKGTVVFSLDVTGEEYILSRGVEEVARGHWTFFKDGDNSDAQFTSIGALEKYINDEFFEYQPTPVPYVLTSANTTNDTLVKAGKTILQSLSVINTSETVRYLKIYDANSTPTSGDTPILVYPIVPQAEDKPIELMPSSMQFFYGFGFRLTANIAYGDETAVGANEIVLNAVYR